MDTVHLGELASCRRRVAFLGQHGRENIGLPVAVVMLAATSDVVLRSPPLPASFNEKLRARWRESDSALCVGLDPRLARLPRSCRQSEAPLLAFCQQIVDATADLVCAFKPQIAYFSAAGAEQDLRQLIEYIRARHPRIAIVLDAKRGDIGTTAELYASEVFERYGADATTVNPYLGWDAIEPFARQPERGAFVLCHTSNPDAAWLQEHPPQAPVYLRVAELIDQQDRGNLGLVVGATFPEQLAAVRKRAPDLPLLVPGVGAQGGSVEAVVANGAAADGAGLLVNASRSIIYASAGEDWASAAREAAMALRDQLRRARDAALGAS